VTARSYESLQRTHPGADGPIGLVIAQHIPENLGRFAPINGASSTGRCNTISSFDPKILLIMNRSLRAVFNQTCTGQCSV
jgi:hypothetical protein